MSGYGIKRSKAHFFLDVSLRHGARSYAVTKHAPPTLSFAVEVGERVPTELRRLLLVLLVAGCSHHPAPRSSPVREPPSNFPMPDLRGLTVEQAEAQLRTAGKRGPVDWHEERCDTTLPVGQVCSTYPWKGAHTLAQFFK